jgi:hypothetical protein
MEPRRICMPRFSLISSPRTIAALFQNRNTGTRVLVCVVLECKNPTGEVFAVGSLRAGVKETNPAHPGLSVIIVAWTP